ncbi:MAG: hypothetical protein ACLT5Z_13125 [Eisenbergiella sp.]|nr:hypothetical protein [Bacillota bacterium]
MVQTKKRFYILPVLFLILIYLDGIFILYFNENWRLILVMVAASAMIGVVNCIFAFTCCRKGKERFLEDCMVFLKYGMIPFYTAVFVLASGMTFMTMLFIGPLSAVIAGIFAILDYAILIVGSCYVISYVVLKARTHGMKAGECALHVILQLFFVTDVLDSMYLTAVRAKRYRVLTSCICLLLAAGLICVGVYMSYSV